MNRSKIFGVLLATVILFAGCGGNQNEYALPSVPQEETVITKSFEKPDRIKLYEKGYYLGIISNNSIRNVEYILEREDIKKYFKKIIISEAVKERKPNLKVYMKAFEDIPKQEYNKIAFVSDELLEDLLGVKILGVKTIWYEQEINNKWKKKEEILMEPDYKIKSMKEILNIV